MIIRLPLIEQAKRDPHLPDAAFRLLVFLEERLDLVEYRPVKHESLAAEAHRKVVTVRKSLGQLEGRRYILAGVHDPLAPREARSTRPTWYRLAYSRGVTTGPSVR